MRTFARALALGLSVLSFHAAIHAQTQVAKSIPNSTSPDGLIGFLEFRPADYGNEKHPLIIFLHGIGERGNGTTQINSVAANGTPNLCANGASMTFTVNGQTSSFVVLSPQLSTQYGYWPTFYVKEMIKYAKSNLSIDPNRIYVTGLSLGGGGVWRLITDTQNFDHSFDNQIAAAAPVCGTQEETDADFCSTIGANNLPVWAFHCMDDGTVGVGATQHAEILAGWCGMTPAMKFTYYQSGGHAGAWINAYDPGHITRTVSNGSSFTASPNLYEWFLLNPRNGKKGGNGNGNNVPPTVNAGPPQNITLPTSLVTLTGTATGNNGASIVSYSWQQTSGPAGGTITSPGMNVTLVTGLVQGNYVFTLTATDDGGLSTSSTVNVTVKAAPPPPPPPPPAPNKIPVANAGPDVTITLPTNSITLDGTGSYDPDGTVATYRWTQTAGPVGPVMADRTAAKTTVTGLTAGNYTWVLQITDNNGAGAANSMNVTVNNAPVNTPALAANKTPVADAGPDLTVNQPLDWVNLSGLNSYDPDGYIVAWHWTQTAGPVGPTIVQRDNSTTTVAGLVPGNYTFVLQVTDNGGLSAYNNVNLTVNALPKPGGGNGQPIGYIRQTVGLWQACDDQSSSSRTPVYASSIANGNIIYLNAAMNNVFNGGYNWFSFTQTLGGPVTAGFAIFPDGSIHLMSNCGNAAAPPPPPPVVQSNLLGYIKLSYGPYQACADPSTNNRMALYGTSLSNGSYVYTDAAMTQKFDGGWNWYSLTPTIGGQVTAAFAVYPIGTIGLLTNCNAGSRTDNSTLSALAPGTLVSADSLLNAKPVKLGLFPNPVRNTATIQLNSLETGAKIINVYNASGVLAGKYTWQTNKGNNTFVLPNIANLPSGLYIADIRDTRGKAVGTVKFVKQ